MFSHTLPLSFPLLLSLPSHHRRLDSPASLQTRECRCLNACKHRSSATRATRPQRAGTPRSCSSLSCSSDAHTHTGEEGNETCPGRPFFCVDGIPSLRWWAAPQLRRRLRAELGSRALLSATAPTESTRASARGWTMPPKDVKKEAVKNKAWKSQPVR
jgi:hypothetical protein